MSSAAEAELADNLEDLQLTDEAQALLADKNLELDEDAQAMLEELTSSQAEVQSMIAMHRQQADELGGMRDNLALEVRVMLGMSSMQTRACSPMPMCMHKLCCRVHACPASIKARSTSALHK